MVGIMNANQLIQTGLFANRTKMIFYLLLQFIDERNEPVGSGVLREDLLSIGIDCSTATIGRYLKELDYLDYTVQQSNMGRIITPGGKAYLKDMNERLERSCIQTEFSKTMKVTEYSELIDLLDARRALETEAARLAACNANEKDIARLMETVSAHQDTVKRNQDPTNVALDFHAVVAEISHNRFISSILNMLIYEEKKLEGKMETLVTRERGRIYVREHALIAQAIEERDEDRAASLMSEHIATLGRAVAEQADE